MSKRRKGSGRLQLEFECCHCGAKVYNRAPALAHDHCPFCQWSRHVMFSYADEPPCFEPMRPEPAASIKGHPMMTLTCTGCGFSRRTIAKHVKTDARAAWVDDETWRELFSASDRGAAVWEIVREGDDAYIERDYVINPAAGELVTV